MVHGQLVALPGFNRKGVALKISMKDIQEGRVQVPHPGVWVFSGYWYGKDPLDVKSYGKVHGQQGKVVGRIRSHWHAKRLCA